jgi:hypothetical protein
MNSEEYRCEEATGFLANVERWVLPKLSEEKIESLNRGKLILLEEYSHFMDRVSDYHRRIEGKHVCVDDAFKEVLHRIFLIERDREPYYARIVEVQIEEAKPRVVQNFFGVEGVPHVWDE